MAPPDPDKANAPPRRRGAAVADLGPGQQSHHTRRAGLIARWECLERAYGDDALQASDLRVLFQILRRLNTESGSCYPSLSRLASDARVNRTSVVRSIRRLEERRYIERTSGSVHAPNEYRMAECAVTLKCTDAPSYTSAPKVGAPTHLTLGAPTHPKPVELNQPNEPDCPFDRFWRAYPRQDARKKAAEAWERLQLDPLVETILADVGARCAAPDQWQDRKFIPLPATYLDGARWQDQWRLDSHSGVAAQQVPDPHADERRALQDQLITLRHDRDVTQLIDSTEYEARAAPIRAKLRQLNPSISSQCGAPP